jgi:hypothetical protein
VPEPLTYGHLADTAARLAASAAARPDTDRLPSLTRETASLATLVAAAARHAAFLARPFDRHSPAHRLARHLTLAADTAARAIPAHTPDPADPWQQAAAALDTAHDLLAAHVGPAGDPRSPDAAQLADPAAVDAATGRLAGIALTAAVRAHELAAFLPPAAPAGRRPAPGTPVGPPPTARALRELADVAGVAGPVHAHLRGERGGLPLDEVGPLLGDHRAPPLDRVLERLRLDAHRLARPDADASHHALLACADLAVLIAGRVADLAAQAAPFGRSRDQIAHRDTADTAGRARDAWQQVAASLRGVHSLGTQSEPVAHLTRDAARLFDAATTPALAGDVRRLPAALTAARRATLILPDLADDGAHAVRALTGTRGLFRRTRSGYTPYPPDRPTPLAGKYHAAHTLSGLTVAGLLHTPGPQPLPQRAARLAAQAAGPDPHRLAASYARPPTPQAAPSAGVGPGGDLRRHHPRPRPRPRRARRPRRRVRRRADPPR